MGKIPHRALASPRGWPKNFSPAESKCSPAAITSGIAGKFWIFPRTSRASCTPRIFKWASRRGMPRRQNKDRHRLRRNESQGRTFMASLRGGPFRTASRERAENSSGRQSNRRRYARRRRLPKSRPQAGYLGSKVSAVLGTHTHVPTAGEKAFYGRHRPPSPTSGMMARTDRQSALGKAGRAAAALPRRHARALRGR